MMAHNAAKVAVRWNRNEWLGLSVCRVDSTRDVHEVGVAALSLLLDRKVLNVDMPGTSRSPIRVHHVDGSPVILAK
jgi:hypothetical protein